MPKLSETDFNYAECQAAIETAQKKECYQYAAAFSHRRYQAANAGDSVREATFALLAQVASYDFSPRLPTEPLRYLGSQKAISKSDFSSDDLDFLKTNLPRMLDPELRARAADVLWCIRRDRHAAEIAVEAYIASSLLLEDCVDWLDFSQRAERALRLAAMLNNQFLIDKSVQHIVRTLIKYDGADPSFLSRHLLELLLEFKAGETTVCVEIARKLGHNAKAAALAGEGVSPWRRAELCLETLTKWLGRSGNTDDILELQIEGAETHVREAEAALPGNPLRAAIHLRQAIEAYRKLPNQKQRITELHEQLLIAERQRMNQLKPIQVGPIDLSERTRKAIMRVEGKTLDDAIMIFAFLLKLPTMESLRAAVERSGVHISDFVKKERLDSEGKVVAIEPSITSPDSKEREAAMVVAMADHVAIQRQIDVSSVIEPVRRHLLSEHSIFLEELESLIVDSPMVPPGREQIYARGLHAGFMGDFLLASHLLIPQLENSFRHILSDRGVITSRLKNKGEQPEVTLKTLIGMPEFKQTFSEEIAFQLQQVFVTQGGPNLRHRLAHGMLRQDEFLSGDVIYAWWLILSLCFQTLVAIRVEREKQTGGQ